MIGLVAFFYAKSFANFLFYNTSLLILLRAYFNNLLLQFKIIEWAFSVTKRNVNKFRKRSEGFKCYLPFVPNIPNGKICWFFSPSYVLMDFNILFMNTCICNNGNLINHGSLEPLFLLTTYSIKKLNPGRVWEFLWLHLSTVI